MNIDAKDHNDEQRLLMVACPFGCVGLASVCLNYGADPMKDGTGMCPMGYIEKDERLVSWRHLMGGVMDGGSVLDSPVDLSDRG